MRGKGCYSFSFYRIWRITPAHAGKSSFLLSALKSLQDHPRTCGEKIKISEIGKMFYGSPPHMRGKVFHTGLYTVGIKDHPRTCGEKSISDKNGSVTVGSPPHMRGKDSIFYIKLFRAGITPAHAGKSRLLAPSSLRRGDHPRTCGEKF